jgi:hypothetical protein
MRKKSAGVPPLLPSKYLPFQKLYPTYFVENDWEEQPFLLKHITNAQTINLLDKIIEMRRLKAII